MRTRSKVLGGVFLLCVLLAGPLLSLPIPRTERPADISLVGEDARWISDRNVLDWTVTDEGLSGVCRTASTLSGNVNLEACPGDVFQATFVLQGRPGTVVPIEIAWQDPRSLGYPESRWADCTTVNPEGEFLQLAVGRSMRWTGPIGRLLIRLKAPYDEPLRFEIIEPSIKRHPSTFARVLERGLRRAGYLLETRVFPRPFWDRGPSHTNAATALAALGLVLLLLALFGLVICVGAFLRKRKPKLPFRKAAILACLALWVAFSASIFKTEKYMARNAAAATSFSPATRLPLTRSLEGGADLAQFIDTCTEIIPEEATVIFLTERDPSENLIMRFFLFPRPVFFSLEDIERASSQVYLAARYWRHPFPPGFVRFKIIDRNHYILVREEEL